MGPKYVRFMFRKKQLERLEYKTGCSNSSSYKKRLRGDKVPHLFRYSCSKSIHFPKSSLSDVDNPNELLSPLSLEREEQGVMVMSHKRQKLNPGRSMIAISSEQTQIRDQANEEKSVELGQKGEVYAESLMEDGELSGERDDNGFTMDLSESVSDSAKDNVQSGERDDNGFTMDLSESVSDGAKDNVQSGERDVNVVSMELSESSVDGAKVDAQKTKPASAPMPESKNVRKPPKAIRIVDAETVQILHKLQGVLSTKSGKLMQYKDVVRTLAVQWAGSKKKLNSLLEDWDRFVVRHPEYFDDRLKEAFRRELPDHPACVNLGVAKTFELRKELYQMTKSPEEHSRVGRKRKYPPSSVVHVDRNEPECIQLSKPPTKKHRQSEPYNIDKPCVVSQGCFVEVQEHTYNHTLLEC
eukprot:560833_1